MAHGWSLNFPLLGHPNDDSIDTSTGIHVRIDIGARAFPCSACEPEAA